MKLIFTQPKVTPRAKSPINYGSFIYINDEVVRKDPKTIFHSPFKEGKKNREYSNPSFMSSDVFYPIDYVKRKDSQISDNNLNTSNNNNNNNNSFNNLPKIGQSPLLRKNQDFHNLISSNYNISPNQYSGVQASQFIEEKLRTVNSKSPFSRMLEKSTSFADLRESQNYLRNTNTSRSPSINTRRLDKSASNNDLRNEYSNFNNNNNNNSFINKRYENEIENKYFDNTEKKIFKNITNNLITPAQLNPSSSSQYLFQQNQNFGNNPTTNRESNRRDQNSQVNFNEKGVQMNSSKNIVSNYFQSKSPRKVEKSQYEKILEANRDNNNNNNNSNNLGNKEVNKKVENDAQINGLMKTKSAKLLLNEPKTDNSSTQEISNIIQNEKVSTPLGTQNKIEQIQAGFMNSSIYIDREKLYTDLRKENNQGLNTWLQEKQEKSANYSPSKLAALNREKLLRENEIIKKQLQEEVSANINYAQLVKNSLKESLEKQIKEKEEKKQQENQNKKNYTQIQKLLEENELIQRKLREKRQAELTLEYSKILKTQIEEKEKQKQIETLESMKSYDFSRQYEQTLEQKKENQREMEGMQKLIEQKKLKQKERENFNRDLNQMKLQEEKQQMESLLSRLEQEKILKQYMRQQIEEQQQENSKLKKSKSTLSFSQQKD